MHPSSSLKLLTQAQKTWERNNSGGSYQDHYQPQHFHQHNNSMLATSSQNQQGYHHNNSHHHHHSASSTSSSSNASRSHNSTPKQFRHKVSVNHSWTELEITGTYHHYCTGLYDDDTFGETEFWYEEGGDIIGDAHGNISNLSPAVFKFTHLTKLNLRNNNLTSLPPEIARLVNLNVLDATGNRLQSIPPEVGDMVMLKELYLGNNLLKSIPYELGKLFQLQRLCFKGNPLPSKYLNFNTDASGTQKLVSFLFDHLPAYFSSPPERAWMRLSNCETPKPAVITVMCYNVLCDKNCNRTLYAYCPQWALNWDYRKKIVMREIKSCQSDIICLQEVETEHYHQFFQPELENDGYLSVFAPKSRARTMTEAEKRHVDGCAIFYKKNKFRALKDYLVEFNQVAIEAAEGSHDMINRVMTKDNIGLAVLLETTKETWPNGPPADNQINQPLLVATCHVHWDPEYCDVKLIQTMMLVQKLQNIVKLAASELRPDLADSPLLDCNSIPLILCGDLNSLPDSGGVEFLKWGRVDSNHKDFKKMGYKECLQKLGYQEAKDNIFSHNFKLSQAYINDIMPYTNYTFEFKGVIDYIFFSRDCMRCLGVLGPPDQKWFLENKVHGCPHPQVPSDHLPIFAQLELLRSSLIPYSYPTSNMSSLANSSSSNVGFQQQQQQIIKNS
ncbi:hypothetical protein HELRODRAFT_97810 [Helobdella robusta]|uniref:poly(A)-specific ribonuclease n=1 Tax=Helobdella robusta TaxID=6412 RepID=T1G9J1_HELRO|nr:hypothetical protein HELRODRAFT_97810 [Helobdella robusta]ESO08875.1 hypothetical protein HELRODRAFT_97810 [Helobdella robusta]